MIVQVEGQARERIEDTGCRVLGLHPEGGLIVEDGSHESPIGWTRELWQPGRGDAAYALIIDGEPYEFVRDLGVP